MKYILYRERETRTMRVIEILKLAGESSITKLEKAMRMEVGKELTRLTSLDAIGSSSIEVHWHTPNNERSHHRCTIDYSSGGEPITCRFIINRSTLVDYL